MVVLIRIREIALIGGLVALLAGIGCGNNSRNTEVAREERYFGTIWDRTMPMPYGCTPGRGEILGAGLAISQTDSNATAYLWISCRHKDGSISINRKATDSKPSGY